MWEQIADTLREATVRSANRLAELIPGIVGLLVILAGAVVIGLVVRGFVLRGLRSLQFDQRAEHLGLGSVADWSVVGGLSLVLARTAMWMIIVAGLLTGLSALDTALADEFSRAALRYMPNVLAAVLIVVLGVIVARFVARSVLIGAVNAHLGGARLLSASVKWLLLLLAWTLALEHVGIGRGLLAVTFVMLFGGIVLAMALAVGLGGKDLVRSRLEEQAKETPEQPDRLTHV